MQFFDRKDFLSEKQFLDSILNSDNKDDFFEKIMALYLWKTASSYSSYSASDFDIIITKAMKENRLQELFGSEFFLKYKGVIFQSSSVLESLVIENKEHFKKFFLETVLKGK